MSNKAKVTLSIDREVIKNAKKIGINISQFCENALREGIKSLTPINSPPELKIKLLNQDSDKNKAAKWTGGDSNPAPSGDITRSTFPFSNYLY